MANAVDFKCRFPEFSQVADHRIQLFLNDAALLMNSKDKWLSFYDVAQAYYAAHLFVSAKATEDGDIGILAPISKQAVDDTLLHQAIEDISASADDLLSTSYGKRYLNYRKIVLTGPRGV